ncbi:PA14 domain-containing protein [Hymenobacter sp. YC55]|uniref:PA14 domain-containing protein n=1 Tax=Hymenobacter sp. YC55 TaxID=3034019 RepID=UPI0023F8F01D|nr:PA14 domain-containing protein [Hymenobacter sp. YC55]
MAQPTACTGNDPGGNPATNGLYAQYYRGYFANDQTYFVGKTAGITRIDANVLFGDTSPFGNLVPTADGTAANPDNFSLRQRGSLRVATTGVYTFYLTADDAAYLWLDNAALSNNPAPGQATIDNGGDHSERTIQASVYLTAGLHNVLIHYGDFINENSLILEYESAAAGIVRQVVPSTEFCTSIQPAIVQPSALTYAPAFQTVLVGNNATSAVPTVTSASTPQFVLANTSSLPAGITINAATGQLSSDATVPVGVYRVEVAVVNTQGAATFRDAYMFTVAAAAPMNCTGTRPDGGPATSGLFAEYYAGYFNDSPAFFTANAPKLVRIDTQLNFSDDDRWGNLALTSNGSFDNPDMYSARYRGRILIPTAGTYTFYLTADDGARLWLDTPAVQSSPVNADALIDNGGQHSALTTSATVTLTAGYHDIQVHYGEGIGSNVLVLEYASTTANIARQVVPASAFCSAVSPIPQSVKPGQKNVHSLSAAPNPNNGTFKVHITQSQPDSGQLQVVDVLGRVLFEKAVPGSLEQDVPVAMEYLPVGMYMLRLITANGTGTQKMVVE